MTNRPCAATEIRSNESEERRKLIYIRRKTKNNVNNFNSKDLLKQHQSNSPVIYLNRIVGNIYPTQRLATGRTNAKEKKKKVNK